MGRQRLRMSVDSPVDNAPIQPPGHLFGEDLLAAGGGQRVVLLVQRLVACADPGVADDRYLESVAELGASRRARRAWLRTDFCDAEARRPLQVEVEVEVLTAGCLVRRR